MSADTLPPHSIEAEAGVLGCIMCAGEHANDTWATAHDKLGGAEAFYGLNHRLLWDALTELVGQQKPLDLITVGQALRDAGKLEEVGGLSWLSELQDAVPSAAHVGYYLDIVRDKWNRRRVLATLARASSAVRDTDDPVDVLADKAASELCVIGESRAQWQVARIGSELGKLVQEMEDHKRGRKKMQGLPTGLNYLDNILCGLKPEQYIVLAGRPGGGKTALAMQIAEHLAFDCNIPVGVFSMEMSRHSLARRMLFSRARVDVRKWLNGFLENEARDVPKLVAATKAMKDAPIIVDEQPGLTAEQLSMRARKMVRDGAQLIIIDYIQLMTGGDRRFKDRNAELTHVSQSLVRLKKELRIPIIVLCQMNRAIETSDKQRRPMLSDIKDCGQIEQDADVVLFVDPVMIKVTGKDEDDAKLRFLTSPVLDDVPAEWKQDDWNKHLTRVDVFVGKNRDGESGIAAECVFIRRWVRLVDCWRGHAESRESAEEAVQEVFT